MNIKQIPDDQIIQTVTNLLINKQGLLSQNNLEICDHNDHDVHNK